MRYFPLLSWFGLSLAFVSCDDGGNAASSCPPGQSLCGNTCLPNGTCMANLGGSTGTGGAPPGPVDPGPVSNPDCTDRAERAGTITQQFGGTPLSVAGGKQYYLSTNWWGKYDGQTVEYNGLSFTIRNPKGVTSDGNDPIGYPTMYIGTYAGQDNPGSNLPKQVSALTTIPTVFSTNAADGLRDQYNAAYDVWFTPTNAKLTGTQYAPPVGGAYLMVWLFKPTARQPRGTVKQMKHVVAGVEGTWDVWVDPAKPDCISYVSTTPLNGLSFDLNHFIQDSVKNNYGITSSMYLSVVFAGFEVWGKGDGLQVKNFCAKVN